MNCKIDCRNFKELYQQFFERGIGSYASNELIIVNAKNKKSVAINPKGEIVVINGYKNVFDNGKDFHDLIICTVERDKITSLDIIDNLNDELKLNQWI